MATGQASQVRTDTESCARWASRFAALVGLGVLASPLVLSGSIGAGTPMWSSVVAGFAIVVLAEYGADAIRSAVATGQNSPGELSGWLAAIVVLRVAVSPFVLFGQVGEGTAMGSTVAAGSLPPQDYRTTIDL